MIPNTYVILQRAVEEGALLGYRRAFKHVENPTEEQIVKSLADAIMLTVSEVFDFPHQSQGDSYL
jgi:hypothetical protein